LVFKFFFFFFIFLKKKSKGGGILLTPMLLGIGVEPSAVSATSSILVLFTSSSTIVQYFIYGAVTLDYALWYIFVGLLSSIIGQFVGLFIRKIGRNYLILLILSAIIIGSLFLTVFVVGSMNVIDIINGEFSGLKSPCKIFFLIVFLKKF
jgi:uncharacterized membrane protein YfcA